MSDPSDAIRDVYRAQRQRAEQLKAAYEAADARTRRSAALVEYRCAANGCLLLFCWRTPTGDAIRLRNYRLAPARNEATSTEAGRARNTSDADNHWNARYFDVPAGDLTYELNCDHVRQALVTVKEIGADVGNTIPGHPVRRLFPRVADPMNDSG